MCFFMMFPYSGHLANRIKVEQRLSDGRRPAAMLHSYYHFIQTHEAKLEQKFAYLDHKFLKPVPNEFHQRIFLHIL